MLRLGRGPQGLTPLRSQVLQVQRDLDRDQRTIKAAMAEWLSTADAGLAGQAMDDPSMSRLLMALDLLEQVRGDMQGTLTALRHAEAGVPMPDGRSALGAAHGRVEAALERTTLAKAEMAAVQKDLQDSTHGRPTPAKQRASLHVSRAVMGLAGIEDRLVRMSDGLAAVIGF
ncbi:MAG: hypothetical protein VKO21_08030 [Candidatus Sericytochromatia bacterium]|nr:hypothetical protein [Candidatus Sericytochromatia bacterium]